MELGASPRAKNAPKTGATHGGDVVVMVGSVTTPSLQEMQRSNLEDRPQICFRNQGSPPAKQPGSWRREEERWGRGKKGAGRGEERWPSPLSRRARLRPERSCTWSACARRTCHTENGQTSPRRKKGSSVKITRNEIAHKSNPITMKFQGGPISF